MKRSVAILLPVYICHKKVKASKIVKLYPSIIKKNTWLLKLEDGVTVDVPNSYIEKHEPKVGGYFVLYEDGYMSFSPQDVFEKGYIKEDEDEEDKVVSNLTLIDSFVEHIKREDEIDISKKTVESFFNA